MSENWDERRKVLRELNLKAWDGTLDFKTKTLDSSLKKNTAYIKKLKLVKKENEKSLIDGVYTLSLEKYLTEIIPTLAAAVVEVTKNDDVITAIELISVLHQRFTTKITPHLLILLLQSVDTALGSKPYEAAHSTLARSILRLITELYLVQVFRSYSDLVEPYKELDIEVPKFLANSISKSPPVVPLILKELLAVNMETGSSLATAKSFLKRFSNQIALINEDSLIPIEGRERLTKIMVNYCEAIGVSLDKLFKSILKMCKTNSATSMRTGRNDELLVLQIEAQKELFDSFMNFYEFAMEYFPDNLKERKLDREKWNIKVEVMSLEESLFVWGSDENRRFYEDYIDVESFIEAKANNTLEYEFVNSRRLLEQIWKNENKGEQLTELLNSLDLAESGKDVEELVFLYWYLDLHNKASMKKILNHFMDCKDLHKFKYYSKFLKLNEEYMAEIINEIIEKLDSTLRGNIYSRGLNFAYVKFFCELFKFRLIPVHVFFHKIRSLILNIEKNYNLALLSTLFEHCGRLLLYSQEYKPHTQKMLELLKQIKRTRSLSIADQTSINHFIASLNPKPIKEIQTEKLSNTELFLLHLFRKELEFKQPSTIAKLLFQFDWTDSKIRKMIIDIFTEPENINYQSIPQFVKVFKLVTLYDVSIAIQAIDALIEKLTIQLEINDIKHSRLRMAQMKYLAELQNVLILDSKVIIPLLYKILCFGHENNNPTREEICEIDLPDDYFRVHLISIFISSLNFEKLPPFIFKKFVIFLRFFDYYIMTKMLPLPTEINMKLERMFEVVGPGYVRSFNFQQAVERLQQAMAAPVNEDDQQEQQEKMLDDADDEVDLDEFLDDISEGVDDSDDDSDDSSDDNSDDDDNGTDTSEDGDEDSDEDDDDENDEEEEVEEEEDEASKLEKIQRRKELEHAFESTLEREFAQMMSDSFNKSKRINGAAKINLPTFQNVIAEEESTETNGNTNGDFSSTIIDSSEPKFQFKLARRNQEFADISVPTESKIIHNLRKRIDDEKKQKEIIKNFVLSSHGNRIEEEGNNLLDSSLNNRLSKDPHRSWKAEER